MKSKLHFLRKWVLLFLTCSMVAVLDVHAQKEKPDFGCLYKNADQSNRMVSNTQLHSWQSGTGEFCVDVKFHKLNVSGFPVINDSEIEPEIGALNSYFPSSIFFSTDVPIEEHDYNDVFSSDPVSTVNGIEINLNAIIDINGIDDPNRLDIVYSANNLGGASFSYEIGNRTIVFIADFHRANAGVAHEVGHAFGLFHTYHGTVGYDLDSQMSIDNVAENNDGYIGHMIECPIPDEGSGNGHIAGDYVTDTTSDIGFDYDITSCDQINNIPQALMMVCEEDPTLPQSNNYMRSRTSAVQMLPCWNSFTPGQINRMKHFLGGELSQIVIDCEPPPPHPCETCEGAQSSAAVIDSTFTWVEECTSATLTIPDIFPENCPQVYRVTWNGGESEGIMDANDDLTHPLPMNFTSNNITYTISVERETEPVPTCMYTFMPETDCGTTNDCATCNETETIADAIAETFVWNEECSFASLTLPFDHQTNCFDETYLVTWEGSSALIDPNDPSTFPITLNFFTNSNEYSITVQRETISCTSDYFANAICDTTTDCGDCVEIGENIVSSFSETSDCGIYRFQVPEGTLSCYDILFRPVAFGGESILLDESMLLNGYFFYNYNDLIGSSFSSWIRIVDPVSGEQCFVKGLPQATVNCFGKQKNDLQDLIVYPNPFVDEFQLINNSKKEIKEIEIYDDLGFLQYKDRFTTEIIDLYKVKAGIYFVKVYFDNNEVKILQIIKK